MKTINLSPINLGECLIIYLVQMETQMVAEMVGEMIILL